MSFRTLTCVTLITLLGFSPGAIADFPEDENLVLNGEFEPDPIGTKLPSGWSWITGSDPAGWMGVVEYQNPMYGGHPTANAGHTPTCYGSWFWDYQSGAVASLTQLLGSGNPGAMHVEGWLYFADNSQAWIKFHLDQGPTHWDSGPIYQICGGAPCWVFRQFDIPADYGFTSGPVYLTIEFHIGSGAGLGAHGVFVDGIYVSSEGLGTGACCLGNNECFQAQDEQECLNHDPPGNWAGSGTECAADANNNQVADVCEACEPHEPFADADGDQDVDQDDFGEMQFCYTGPGAAAGEFDPILCSCLDANGDQMIDQLDIQAFEACASGPGVPADSNCAP
jgi:hypothetical protein